MTKKINVVWLGLRGFPGVEGGVEAHAEHLCTQLAKLGCDVTVLTRSRFHTVGPERYWQGVRMKKLWCPFPESLETILHTLVGVIYAAIVRPDILHIQAIGPAFWTPLARSFDLTVVVTHHGRDYDRQKWGSLARLALRAGEYCGMRFASRRIVISPDIQKHVQQKFKVEPALISNGVIIPAKVTSSDIPGSLGLTRKKYILMVGRFVPEKRHLDLIEAFSRASLPGWKLVLAGDNTTMNPYCKSVLQVASSNDDIVCTGFRTGRGLAELYANAGFFVLPSSHEGLSISILEAMSHGLPVIASDIPANGQLRCAGIEYFPPGDVEALATMLQRYSTNEPDEWKMTEARRLVESQHDWLDIARRTYELYGELMTVRHGRTAGTT